MRRIFDPVSGEEGYFTTTEEKELIDAIIRDSVNSSNHSLAGSGDRG